MQYNFQGGRAAHIWSEWNWLPDAALGYRGIDYDGWNFRLHPEGKEPLLPSQKEVRRQGSELHPGNSV